MGSVKNTLREEKRERDTDRIENEKPRLSLCILQHGRISLAFNNIYLPVIVIVVMMVGNVFVQDARISFVSSLKRGERGYNSYNCMESTPTNQNSSPSNGFNNMHHAFSSCNHYLCAPML